MSMLVRTRNKSPRGTGPTAGACGAAARRGRTAKPGGAGRGQGRRPPGGGRGRGSTRTRRPAARPRSCRGASPPCRRTAAQRSCSELDVAPEGGHGRQGAGTCRRAEPARDEEGELVVEGQALPGETRGRLSCRGRSRRSSPARGGGRGTAPSPWGSKSSGSSLPRAFGWTGASNREPERRWSPSSPATAERRNDRPCPGALPDGAPTRRRRTEGPSPRSTRAPRGSGYSG